MNIKRIWLVLPTLLLPYFMILVLCTVFFATDCSIFRFIMEDIFDGNGLLLIGTLLVFCLIATILNLIYFFVSIGRGWDVISMAKTAMIIKLIQIPAYIAIFVVGLACAITIFTFAVSILLFFLDCFTLFLTGLLNAAAIVGSVRKKVFVSKEVYVYVILQFIFCADVVASVIFYKQLKKRMAGGNKNDRFVDSKGV